MREYDRNGDEIIIPKKLEEARQVAFAQISKKAVLINVIRRQMSNMPFDVQLTMDVAKSLNIPNHEMLQIRKFLIDPIHFGKIRSLLNDATLLVWNHTRPWDNLGYRILAIEYYDDFVEVFGKIKDEFEEAVKEFADNFNDYVLESKKNLGKAFNKKDYPSTKQIKTLFELNVETKTFPDIDDIRINMSGTELLSFQQEITETYDNTIKNSLEELIDILNKDPNNANVNQLFKLVESLNIINDIETTEKLEQLKKDYNIDLSDNDNVSESMMVYDDIDLDEDQDDNDEGETLAVVDLETPKEVFTEVDNVDDNVDEIIEML